MPRYDVGIVIPVYNGFRGVSGSTWMLDSIESALHSDHPNFCVTVVDDGSTDGSLSFVHEMLNRANRGKNIQVIEVNKNVGVGRALNIASPTLTPDISQRKDQTIFVSRSAFACSRTCSMPTPICKWRVVFTGFVTRMAS